ncbi:hypothetical protein SASPL_120693 [Salvia splendens]|uniref:Uncharacterized protein n=1 Tax=Salvia splendens TaxID=180675 RepID=A0A8X8XSY3_SALSN|nr:hypothetical protein SASPL_120693 [Salvia splendens]
MYAWVADYSLGYAIVFIILLNEISVSIADGHLEGDSVIYLHFSSMIYLSTRYSRMQENNKTELERLEKEKHDDFVNMLKGLIVNQAGYAEKMANVWETVAEETSAYIRKS